VLAVSSVNVTVSVVTTDAITTPSVPIVWKLAITISVARAPVTVSANVISPPVQVTSPYNFQRGLLP